MATVKRGTVVRMIWKKARLTRELWGLVSGEDKECNTSGEKAYRERLDTAMLAVKRTEKAANMTCSLRPRCESLKYPSFNKTPVPAEAKVACRQVNSQGNLNWRGRIY